MILAWSDLLGELPPATKAAAQEAQPLSVDDNVITFGVAPVQLPNAKPRFQKEADTIRDALSSRLGRRMLFRLIAHEGFESEPQRSGSRAAPHSTMNRPMTTTSWTSPSWSTLMPTVGQSIR